MERGQSETEPMSPAMACRASEARLTKWDKTKFSAMRRVPAQTELEFFRDLSPQILVDRAERRRLPAAGAS
jgi:hypothetical protein